MLFHTLESKDILKNIVMTMISNTSNVGPVHISGPNLGFTVPEDALTVKHQQHALWWLHKTGFLHIPSAIKLSVLHFCWPDRIFNSPFKYQQGCTIHEWGVLASSSLIPLLDMFKISFAPLNYIHIWQVTPPLSCGDTCQIWMWYPTGLSFEKWNKSMG